MPEGDTIHRTARTLDRALAGTTIEWASQGEQRRGTYWCPACQAPSLRTAMHQ